MEIFAEKEKLELDRGIFLTEEVVKDKRSDGNLESSDQGVWNVVLLSQRNNKIEKMRMLEHAAEESKNTRTLRDAERLSKNDTRSPPRTYNTLKSNISSTCVLLGAIYGKKCPAYIKLRGLYKALNSKEALMPRSARSLCGQRMMTCGAFLTRE
jgi:hypothetical protein